LNIPFEAGIPHLLKGEVVFDIYDVLIQSTTSADMQTDEENSAQPITPFRL
jgi:hypothetical protein